MANNVCIVQLADWEYYEKRKNCVDSVRKYCLSQGYEWRGLTGTLDKSTHIAYQKPRAILGEIDNFDYVGWIDMDVVVVNRSFDLVDYLDQKEDVVVCRDPSFAGAEVGNSGVTFFRNTNFSKQLLKQWWDFRVTGTDKHWRHQYKGSYGDADQHFLNQLLKHYDIKIQNPHDLNIHPKNFKIGDFAIHFMGHNPIDYELFVEYAQTINDQNLIDKYWMVYGFQSWSLIDRYYENTRDDLFKNCRYTPNDIFECAKKIIDIDVPH